MQSPCGLRAYDTPFGKMLGGPSQETPSRTGQQIIQKFISNSNFCSAQIVKSFTTACASSTKVHTSQSKKESSTETGNTCLLYPNENKASLSNASNGLKEEDDKKMMVDELNNANFDLSLFWKIESFANLDGADAVESNSRSTLSKTKSHAYLTDATLLLFHGQQINGDWKKIFSWPQGDWRAR